MKAEKQGGKSHPKSPTNPSEWLHKAQESDADHLESNSLSTKDWTKQPGLPGPGESLTTTALKKIGDQRLAQTCN